MAEVRRGISLGIRSFLVADLGVLQTLGDLRKAGAAGVARPEDVGAASVCQPCDGRGARGAGRDDDQRVDGPVRRRARRLRAACAAPLDVYVEVPDDQGGFVRFYDVPDIVRVAAPVYVKLGLRNAPNIYPSGLHLDDLAVKLGRERVRRAGSFCACSQSARAELVEARGDERPPDLRDPRAVRGRFAAIYTAALADILDARGYHNQALPPTIGPLEQGSRLAGPAYTVKGGPATNRDEASYDVAIRKVLAMLGDVAEGGCRRLLLPTRTSRRISESCP